MSASLLALGDEARRSLLTRLTRLARRRPNQLGCLESAFKKRLDEKFVDLILEVAVETGDPIGKALAAQVTDQIALQVAQHLVGRCRKDGFSRSVPLIEVALVANWMVRELGRQILTDPGEVEKAELARLTHDIAMRLDDKGSRTEALAEYSQATELYRELADASPGRYLRSLSASLHNRALTLLALERRDEAVEVALRAVELDRNPPRESETPTLDLVQSLNTYGRALFGVGRAVEAVVATQESVKILRNAAKGEPVASVRQNLAGGLGYLSQQLLELDEREQALAAAREATSLLLELVEQRPDMHLPDLARSLNQQAMILHRLDDFERALTLSDEATLYFEQLSDQRPEAFLADFAASLSVRGSLLGAVGRNEDAAMSHEKAIAHLRELRRISPELYRRSMANILNNLGLVLIEMGEHARAEDAYQESLDLLQGLVEERPEIFRSDFATALSNYGVVQLQYDAEKAYSSLRQAAQALRELSATQPALRAGCALALQRLSAACHHSERRGEAADTIAEAVDIYRRLSDEEPAVFERDLVESLDDQANRLEAVGRYEKTLDVSRESVQRYRQLDHEVFDFRPGLAASLTSLSTRLSSWNHFDAALEAANESVEIRRQLVEGREDHFFVPILATSLVNLGLVLNAKGDANKGLTAIVEAVELYRALVPSQQRKLLPEMSKGLDALAILLSDLGRNQEALPYIRAAVSGYKDLVSRPSGKANLALSLLTLGKVLHGAGSSIEALEITIEAADILHGLATDWPDVYHPAAGRSRHNLGILLRDLGRPTEARDALEDAVEIRGKLVQAAPDAFRPALAQSLSSLAAILDDLGEHQLAHQHIHKAMRIQKRLSTADNAHTADLAMTLLNLSIISAHLGRALPAALAAEEAASLFRPIADRYPEIAERFMNSAVDVHMKTAKVAGIKPADQVIAWREAASGA